MSTFWPFPPALDNPSDRGRTSVTVGGIAMIAGVFLFFFRPRR